MKEKEKAENINLFHEVGNGASALPVLARDITDRNRTSPFAFTGTKLSSGNGGRVYITAGPNPL